MVRGIAIPFIVRIIAFYNPPAMRPSQLIQLASVALLTLCFSFSTKAQSQQPDSATLRYFKIDVGMHILDCPVLPPNLRAKLLTLKGIKDYTVNFKAETIQFTVPDGVVTPEVVVKIAMSCGFPQQAVNVSVSDKPFTN